MALLSVASSISFGFKATQTQADDGFGLESDAVVFPFTSDSLAYNAAGGSGKIRLLHRKQYVIAGSGTLNLVLGDGSLLDKYGAACAFAKVREFAFHIAGGVDGDKLVIGNAASHAWTKLCSDATKTFDLQAGGIEFRRAPLLTAMAVVTGTDEKILFTNPGANPITLNVMITGE